MRGTLCTDPKLLHTTIMRKELEKALKSTFALDLLGESGSPEEGKEELYSEVEKFIDSHILGPIRELIDEENLQSAQDMQDAIFGIYEILREFDGNKGRSLLSEDQEKELERRMDEWEKNPEIGIPWEEVKSRLINRKNLK